MPERIPFAKLEGLLRKCVDSKMLRHIEVFAIYQGKPLDADKKSVSVRLHFGSDQSTLSSEVITQLQTQVMTAVKGEGFSLRE